MTVAGWPAVALIVARWTLRVWIKFGLGWGLGLIDRSKLDVRTCVYAYIYLAASPSMTNPFTLGSAGDAV